MAGQAIYTFSPLQFKLIVVVDKCVVHFVPSWILKEGQGEVAEHIVVTAYREEEELFRN